MCAFSILFYNFNATSVNAFDKHGQSKKGNVEEKHHILSDKKRNTSTLIEKFSKQSDKRWAEGMLKIKS